MRVAAFAPILVFSILVLTLAHKLWGYSSAIGKLLLSQAPADMEAALDAQRRFWRVAGLVLVFFTIIFLGVAFLGSAVPA